MSARAVALIALLAAVVGGIAGAVIGGVVGGGDTTTTVIGASPALTTTGTDTVAAPAVPAGAFDAARIYAARSPGVVTLYADLGAEGGSQGSGFVVDRNGTILTNAHVITNVTESPKVVRGADRLYAEFEDGERVPATVVGWDLFDDVGVVRVDPKAHALAPVPLGNSDTVRVGEPVAAIGSPFGQQNSLAVGVVSATRRAIDSLTSGFAIADAIQIDAPINRGNSGGPLFDAVGRVIGINAQIQSASGTAEGVGFAVPINSARRSLGQILRTGTVRVAYVGIKTQGVTPGVARALGLGTTGGALVASVDADTPAARAGLRAGTGSRTVNGIAYSTGGDLVVSIAGRPVRSSEDVGRIVSERLRPGQVVRFVVVRDGRRVVIPVTLAARPDTAR